MLAALRRDRFGPISGVLCGLQILLRRSRHRQDTVGKAPRCTSTARGAPPPISLCAVRSHASPGRTRGLRPHCLVAGDVRGQPDSVLYGAETLVVTHLHRDWACPATSAPGLRLPCHICTGTALTPATSAPGLGLARPCLPCLHSTEARRRSSLQPSSWSPPAQATALPVAMPASAGSGTYYPEGGRAMRGLPMARAQPNAQCG